MAINPIQEKALQLIESDPEAFRMLQEQVHRLDPEGKVIPKSALPDISLQERIDSAIKPLREQNAKLEEDLRKKQELDDHQFQRDFMRRTYHMKDAEIDDLAKWMKEDADGNIYKSYEAAHKYRLAMKQPIIPNGSAAPNKISPMTGRQVRNSQDEPWREDIAKRRKDAANPRAADRAKAKEEWAKTISELRQR